MVQLSFGNIRRCRSRKTHSQASLCPPKAGLCAPLPICMYSRMPSSHTGSPSSVLSGATAKRPVAELEAQRPPSGALAGKGREASRLQRLIPTEWACSAALREPLADAIPVEAMPARQGRHHVVILEACQAHGALLATEIFAATCGQTLDASSADSGPRHCLVQAQERLVVVGRDFSEKQVEDRGLHTLSSAGCVVAQVRLPTRWSPGVGPAPWPIATRAVCREGVMSGRRSRARRRAPHCWQQHR
mmetsp:Transcript_47825/g.102514  ORF Transcript_47825/g.102514 Transcript_47825/m.102514 type:complete len:246 (+) Transcript_47825:454-1191(+)